MRPAAFVTSKTSEGKTGVLAKPAKLLDDQVQVARFMNLLNRYYAPKVIASWPRMRCVMRAAHQPK